MQILADSWLVLTKDGNIIFGILLAFLLAGGVIFFSSRVAFGGSLSYSERLAVSAAGAPCLLLLEVSLLGWLGYHFKVDLAFLFMPILVLACGSLFFATLNIPGSEKEPEWAGIFPFLGLLVFLAGSTYLRLAFISHLIVPPYFDSAVHALLINRLIASYQNFITPSFDSIAGGYYHLGFHALLAAFGLALQTSVKDTMLVFGQILLALIPLPVFLLVRRETRSDPAAFFAVLLAGWGWNMPAYSLNWGKYPALTGILAFEFTCCIVVLLLRTPQRRWWLYSGMGLLSIGAATFFHSRTLILAGILLLSLLAAFGWQRLNQTLRRVVFFCVVAGLAALVAVLRSKPVVGLVLDPYLRNGVWVSLAVLGLFIFACLEFPRPAFACSIALVLLMGSLLVPVLNLVPGHAFETLLDRPFAEMVLFLPLSIVGGFGLAGLVKILDRQAIRRALPWRWMPALVTCLLLGLVIAYLMVRSDFYPSACCRIFSEADAVAFDWMDRNLSPHARILIASSDMVVFEPGPLVSQAGSDAGIWLTPLIHRKTFSMSFLADFLLPDTQAVIREHAVRYIYIGGTNQTFLENELQNDPSFYQPIFSIPGAHIYQVIGVP